MSKLKGLLGILLCLILFCTVVCGMRAYASYPEKQLERLVGQGNYEKAVKIFNENFVGSDHKFEGTFLDAITNIKREWKQGNVSYKDAVLQLQKIAAIQDKKISSEAKETMEFISREGTGKECYEVAKTLFEEKDYMGAMRCLKRIDKRFLTYADVEVLYKRCVNGIVNQTKNLETLQELDTWIEKLEAYYDEIAEPSFLTRKEQLKKEREILQDVIAILNRVAAYFEEGSYGNAFAILEGGMEKYPDNEKVSSAYEKYHNRYVADITSIVEKACEYKAYKEALSVVETARNVHECKEFQELEEFVKEERSILYRWKNNIMKFLEEI